MTGLFGKKSTPVLGVDISSSAIKLVELGGSAAACRVERYAIEPLPANAVVDKRIEDSEVVGQTLERAVAKSGSRLKTCAVAVAGATVITRVIPMPNDMSEMDMAEQILIEADQYIPYDMEDVNYDFSILGPNKENPEESVDVLLAASQRENVERRVECCEYAGLTPKVVDIEAYATEHAFELLRYQVPEHGAGKVAVIVDVGATATGITVLHDGETVYTRDQTFGGRQLTEAIMNAYGLSLDEATQKKHAGELPDNYQAEVLTPFMENLVQEINRALQFFYASSAFDSIDNIIMAGGTGAMAGVSEKVQELTGAQTLVARPAANIKVAGRKRAERLRRDDAAMLIAFGLALRSFD